MGIKENIEYLKKNVILSEKNERALKAYRLTQLFEEEE